MEIIGVVFYNSLHLYIVKVNNELYCGECLFIYNSIEQAKTNVKLIKLDTLPKDCIIRIFDFRTKC